MNAANSYRAYSKATHTVAKTRQVVILYDGAIRFLKQAQEAMEKKDIELRYRKLTKAAEIIMGLQSCLDFESGGEAAKVLYDFYAAMDLRIMTLHREPKPEACAKLIEELKAMRNVWDRIDRGDAANADESTEESALPAGITTVSA